MAERSEQERVRFEKLARLRSEGYPFPNDVGEVMPSSRLLSAEILPPEAAPRFSLAGRLMQIRLMGKAAFAHVLDGAGKFQIYLRRDDIGEAQFQRFKDLDIGDIVQVRGYLFLTKTGERTIHCESLRLLTKCLIPLPEKWHGLTDVEARYRQRYVDLISNPEARDIFRQRSLIIREIRSFLDQRGYLEVETPVLHYIPGGANARPFATHHNAMGVDMFLRIALELPLKKLVVGGLERVYEIGRVFRNEGVSRKHNPEFSMLEFYQAYATYEDLMTLTQDLITGLVQKLHGRLTIRYGDRDIDFTPPWPRVSMLESIHRHGGVDRRFDLSTSAGLVAAADSCQVELAEPSDWGRSLEELWAALAEPKIVNPVFLTQHPFSISPLARKNLANPQVTDRFELIICGLEVANAFSELNDPVDQRERFEAQARRKAAGDEEATDVDEDFLRALEYGLPPTGGEGIGIDRLVMLLSNSASIREVICFPHLKPDDPACSGEDQEVEEA